jgi:hypothetical protein
LPASWSTAQAVQPCVENCSTITVGSGTASPGGSASIEIDFAQGPDDGDPGQGNDEIAAIAFTLGIPGDGAGNPLTIDCDDDDSDGVPNGITVDASIRDTFRVVIENVACTNRNRCLCPSGEQSRDDFINVAIYGPKDLPEEGPVEIPVLPSDTLMSVVLVVTPGTPGGDIPLTIFSEDGAGTKPQYGAYLSQGDQAAVDQTVDRGEDVSKIQIVNGKITVDASCVGDCNSDGTVTVDELVKGVNIALGEQDVSVCPAFDENQNGGVTVDELVKGVNNALNGCPGA